MIDLNKIEAAAKAATPGPWVIGHKIEASVCTDTFHHGEWAIAKVNMVRVEGSANADHIATANPAAVLEMVSMIRDRDAVLKKALEALERIHKTCAPELSHQEELIVRVAHEAITAIKEVLK